MSTTPPARFVVAFDQIDRTHADRVGGKGANLGELGRIDQVRIPAGFCVTTEAFALIVEQAPAMHEWFKRLGQLTVHDPRSIADIGAGIRRTIRTLAIPEGLAGEIRRALACLAADAYAVRSSATTEDLPTASFAGQHDSYLNVVGAEAVLDGISGCWASTFTDRAIAYRIHNRIDHRRVRMAVVVQELIDADASGVIFTADPATSDRTIATIEATFGLGEALVSGRVKPDIYRVRNDEIIDKTITPKELTVRSSPEGGTAEQPVPADQRSQPALTDPQVLTLSRLGRSIENHFGHPQDIEWCLGSAGFQVVQSRPITTLFPVPVAGDGEQHVYISVGHQQMMTDPMKPLGISMWQLTTPAPMSESAGRLFVDVTARLATPDSRRQLLEMARRADPLMHDALETLVSRGDPFPSQGGETPIPPLPTADPDNPIAADPDLVTELIDHNRASVAALKDDIRSQSGGALFDFILGDLRILQQLLRQGLDLILAAMDATWWLNDHLSEWLDVPNAADVLTRSAPNNITSEMGLALLDVADAIRPHPDVVAYLEHTEGDGFLAGLDQLEGGSEARTAIEAFLEQYGMRCVGEIDITRPRWAEQPSQLVPTILGNIHNFEPGAAARRFEEGRQAAEAAKRDFLARLRTLPEGARKAAETKRKIELVRAFIGYREYPKYGMICRYYVYKQALLGEAARLAGEGVIRDIADVFYLTFHEFREAVLTDAVDQGLIDRRREAHRWYRSLSPPRVLTSAGEALNGSYRRNGAPSGAMVGLAVSSGIFEGRARVVTNIADADVVPGDILVTTHTDPSWSPLFVTIGGLVTEVGGLMTHGAVVAREYGLPAVVGVENATRTIRDGQRIRINGTDGYVEILATEAP